MNTEKPSSEEQKLLAELDRLRAAESTPGAEPPLMIDQAVKNRARRELATKPVGNGDKLRWIAGLSTASIALIALGISLVQSPAPTLPNPSYEPSYENSTEPAAPMELHRQTQGSNTKAKSDDMQSLRSSTAETSRAPRKQEISKSVPVDQPDSPAGATFSASMADEARSDSADRERSLEESLYSEPGETDPVMTAKPAEAWLDLIRQLHEQGLRQEAWEQLETFKQSHPDYQLPDWVSAIENPDA